MLNSVFTTLVVFIVFVCVSAVVAMQVMECLALAVF